MQDEETTVQRAPIDAVEQSPAASDGTAPTDAQMRVSMAIVELQRRFRSGAHWFYWIAGLSLINTLVLVFHGSFFFVAGLAATQFVGEITSTRGSVATIIGLLINLSITGIYVLFGYCATSRMRWAFIVGMILYSLDALVFMMIKDWLAFGFHVFALYGIYSGMNAEGMLRKIEAEAARSVQA